MKKIILFFCFIFIFISKAWSDGVSILSHEPRYPMKITYQICPLNAKKYLLSCDSLVETFLENGMKNIELENFAWYVRILNATEFNLDGSIKAYGAFPDEEDCKVFWLGKILLTDDEHRNINCSRIQNIPSATID